MNVPADVDCGVIDIWRKESLMTEIVNLNIEAEKGKVSDIKSVELFCRKCGMELVCTVTVVPLQEGGIKLVGDVDPCEICTEED